MRKSMALAAAAIAMAGIGGITANDRVYAIEPRQRPAWMATRKFKRPSKRFGKKHDESFEKLPEWLKNYVLKKRAKYSLRNEKRQRNYEKCLQNGIFKGHFGERAVLS